MLKAVSEKRVVLQYSRFCLSSAGSRAHYQVKEAAQRLRPHPKCGAAAYEIEEGNHYQTIRNDDESFRTVDVAHPEGVMSCCQVPVRFEPVWFE